LNQNQSTNVITYKNAGNFPYKILGPPKFGGPRLKPFQPNGKSAPAQTPTTAIALGREHIALDV